MVITFSTTGSSRLTLTPSSSRIACGPSCKSIKMALSARVAQVFTSTIASSGCMGRWRSSRRAPYAH
ncbi:unnamed protein product [Effrenium voratum]|nr:unnamed protein product [Effrenium voratum]